MSFVLLNQATATDFLGADFGQFRMGPPSSKQLQLRFARIVLNNGPSWMLAMVALFLPASGRIEYLDTSATNYPHRFYWALEP